MNYGLENYEYRNVYEETPLGPLLVEGGVPESGKPYDDAYLPVEVAETDGGELNVLLRDGENVERNVLLPEKLTAPVEAGTRVGAVNYYLDGELLREYPVRTAGGTEKLDFPWMVRYLWMQYSL